MPADTAKYLLSLADIDPKTVEIAFFSGIAYIFAPGPRCVPALYSLQGNRQKLLKVAKSPYFRL
ncbi:MAG: hypothetical protein FWB85_02230 [Chitinispirillia bacterium]|nr:hypothetical protein [Chitinispirillia bacterium]